MLDGQRLFNRLGEELLVLAGGEDACGTKDVTGRALDASRRARLAADLELWFERYRVQWLSIGRYAELARIAMWCGRLRTYCVGERYRGGSQKFGPAENNVRLTRRQTHMVISKMANCCHSCTCAFDGKCAYASHFLHKA